MKKKKKDEKRILIIDNDTKTMKELKEALKNQKIKIINFRKFKKEQVREFTHIILTGRSHWIDLKKFSEEIKLIRNPPVPILGICYGMQLIGKSFGSTLKKLDKLNEGNISVNILRKDKLLEKIPRKIKVFEHRKYAINKLGKELRVLGISDHGIEIIKHKKLSIFGTQFHPEVVFKKENIGRRIIKNFLKIKEVNQ